MGIFSFKFRKEQKYENKEFNKHKENHCKVCESDCLNQDLFKTIGIGFSYFPISMQEKMEELRELFVKINQAIEKENNYKSAQLLKEQAIDVYAELCGLMVREGMENIAEQFGSTVELMMQRHMSKRAYEFINS
ncbi:MAG: hypothetical protein NC918_04560 [Candidatus Omnitrophica bacterium]|nr:hypothetical protein [Candidatus Omnitrophota bacterium]